jgi:L-iditol 2-dehydrogenase
MKAAHFTGLKKVEIVELPMPKPGRPDDVLLRIERVGVCGSDVHYYREGRIGEQALIYPATVGHECAGTVVETGAEVAHVRPGDHVAVDPAVVCGTCDQCRQGRPNTCRHLQFMGAPGEALGAVAEYRVVPAANCFPIPANMTLDEAALAEPLSVGLHAVHLGEVAEAARLVIIGAGPIGLSVLLCAKATAACTVYMTDLLDQRLEVARRCGADWTGTAIHGQAIEAILQKAPQGVDLVFECAGDPLCIDEAQKLLAPGGTLVIVGIPPTDRVIFGIHHMRRKELTFKNVRRQRGCVAPVIEMIAAGRIDPKPLLTHRFPLDRIAEAFDLVATYRDGVIKTLIDLEHQPEAPARG